MRTDRQGRGSPQQTPCRALAANSCPWRGAAGGAHPQRALLTTGTPAELPRTSHVRRGAELGSSPQGRQGQTLLQPLLPLGELWVTPHRDTGPGQLVDRPVVACCSEAPGDMVLITARRTGKGECGIQTHRGAGPMGRVSTLSPQEQLCSHCQSRSGPAQLWGWAPISSSAPGPQTLPEHQGGGRGPRSTPARGSWGRHT